MAISIGFNKSEEKIRDIARENAKKGEEWIWIEGYKGTNSDMTCRDQQYEIGKTYVMPEDVDIEVCRNGFHLCLGRVDVFDYYKIGEGHRFFKVKALVRKSDFDNMAAPKTELTRPSMFDALYTMPSFTVNSNGMLVAQRQPDDKITAKSIEFIRELTIDEIFQNTYGKDWSEEDKKLALANNMEYVDNLIREREAEKKRREQEDVLMGLGYSLPFARYITEKDLYDVAYAVGSQHGLSMDMKVLAIMKL